MTTPAHHPPGTDPAAPLGMPAIALAVVTLCIPLLAIDAVSGWIADYGSLTYAALALYVACALHLLRWGVSIRRTALSVKVSP
ncbi:hypothetical protein [Nocardia bovistercoris]|uniref:Uncharacterized protein n=1 Tax=Nocardia bovistercoris TaxID=2785916 RepID=A0A931IH87_9NOCA|nr:hypothetical protein [Nocardia bovistercoris]MBH0781737.1 hypothetical protein [Nocardia bovistercoris]